jgi:hypothetical protein
MASPASEASRRVAPSEAEGWNPKCRARNAAVSPGASERIVAPHAADRVLARNIRGVPGRRGPKTGRADELDRDAVGIGHAQARLAELRRWHLVPNTKGDTPRQPETDALWRDREGEFGRCPQTGAPGNPFLPDQKSDEQAR